MEVVLHIEAVVRHQVVFEFAEPLRERADVPEEVTGQSVVGHIRREGEGARRPELVPQNHLAAQD
jgi:hypothetical protein